MKMRSAALLLVGSLLLCGCQSGAVRPGVTVNGQNVGGMRYEEAEERIRKSLVRQPLVLHFEEGDFLCPLDYSDDLSLLLHTAKRGQACTVTVRREWVMMEEILDMVCRAHVKEGKDAQLTFGKDGFSYLPEERGSALDHRRLVQDVTHALACGESEIFPVYRELIPEVTEEMLRERTKLLASFTTAYDPANSSRSANIALAASRITGTVMESGECFSFNGCVGARTLENGFREAPIIVDGAFVSGVGGGVCQASTTLFGAALRAGLEIVESRPHSLSVGYVAPSQDAMVSSSSDLKFVNPYPTPIYISGEAKDGEVTFSVYGMPDGRRFEVESKVLFRMDPPEAKIVEGTCDRTLREGRAGLASESWLLCYEGETLLSRTLIRRDTYACVQAIIERAPAPLTPDQVLHEEIGEEDAASILRRFGRPACVSERNIDNMHGFFPKEAENACFFFGNAL